MSEGAAGDWPDVDVVMPIRNEVDHLEVAVDAVRAQDYPGRLRIVIGLGPSDDGTDGVAGALAARHRDVVVVDNPSGRTPNGLNAAIRAGSAPVVVRVDGHSELPAGYVRRAVGTMRRTGAVNVGGRQVPVARSPFERAVAAATTSWLGTGGASYRVGGAEGSVDTVFLGVFDRRAIEDVGLFDEGLIRNQDYELNIRLRKAGGVVWFDPDLWVGYRPRGSWRTLARQYYEYGFWKAVVMRLHPGSTRLRQVVPPVAIVGVVVSAILALRWRPFGTVPLAAAAVAAIEVERTARRTGAPRVLLAPIVALIPTSWAAGLVRGLLSGCYESPSSPGGTFENTGRVPTRVS